MTLRMHKDSPYEDVLERALFHARAHLSTLADTSVSATVTKDELRSRLNRPLAAEGLDPARVLDELVSDSAGGWLGSAGGRFFGWVIGGSLPAALAADWLTSAWDQNATLSACGPGAAGIEAVSCDSLK